MAHPHASTGLLCAESARAAIKSMEAEERAQLRQAGKNKLEEYRRLKAALMQGDYHAALSHAQSSFTTRSAPAPRPATPEPQLPTQQQAQQQQQQQQQQHEGDPMVDVLLAQVSSLMSEKQKLVAECSSLQRENEQLIELVGFLTGGSEVAGQQEANDMELGSPVSSSSKAGQSDSWPAALQQQQQHDAAEDHAAQMRRDGCSSSTEAVTEISWQHNDLFSQE